MSTSSGVSYRPRPLGPGAPTLVVVRRFTDDGAGGLTGRRYHSVLAVLTDLAQQADKWTGIARVTAGQIAGRVGRCVRTVQQALRDLEALGLVSYVRGGIINRARGASTVRVLKGHLLAMVPAGVAAEAERAAGRAASFAERVAALGRDVDTNYRVRAARRRKGAGQTMRQRLPTSTLTGSLRPGPAAAEAYRQPDDVARLGADACRRALAKTKGKGNTDGLRPTDG